MNLRSLALAAAAALLLGVGIALFAPAPPSLPLTPVAAGRENTTADHPGLAATRLKPPVVSVPEPEPFWTAAVVPDPVRPRLPQTAAVSASSPIGNVDDTLAAMQRLEILPPTPARIRELNSLTVLLYAQSPEAAADWLERTMHFQDLGPAVSSIAATIAEQGDLAIALEWVDFLADASLRREALFTIYNLEARRRSLTAQSLTAAGFSSEEISGILARD